MTYNPYTAPAMMFAAASLIAMSVAATAMTAATTAGAVTAATTATKTTARMPAPLFFIPGP